MYSDSLIFFFYFIINFHLFNKFNIKEGGRNIIKQLSNRNMGDEKQPSIAKYRDKFVEKLLS